MTNPDGDAAGDSPWGTWEELILAFAVNRHGTDSWDSISSELRKRTSDPNLSLTAHNCRAKYLDLRRRHVAADDLEESASAAPLLEELRKLRVAELRREVRRYDLNIESLELKVKSMTEEREKKSRSEKNDSDLEMKTPAAEEEKRDDEPGIAGEKIEESEKDQFSVNESNSTDLEAEKLETGEKEPEPGPDDRTGKTTEEPAGLNPKPDSCNGSSNSIEKTEPAAESDGGDETAKENSDVQSTASRSRKEGSDLVRRGNTSSDRENQSLAVKEFSTQSQPLFDFLQTLRSRKLGSTFERRLRSQETSIYNKLILQHIDLETVETRLRQGWYSGSRTKFFRDLMLLANNALVFFPKKSAECRAANDIRALVSKEITVGSGSASSSAKQSKKPEENPLMLKTRIPGSLIVCRKRSSIAAKGDKKKEPQKNRIPSSTSSAKKNSTKQGGKGGSSSENPKGESNKKGQTDTKKRGAASFLSRIKKDSSSNNGALLDALKNTPLVADDGKRGGSSEERKNENVKHGEKKKSVGESTKEKGSPGKRVGRPPKRGGGLPGKRGRERGEAESPPGKQKKRMRKV